MIRSRRRQVTFAYLIAVLLHFVACGTDSVMTWTKTFGSVSTDNAGEVMQTSDGGYIFTGSVHCRGGRNCDVYLAKFDANGNVLWEQTYGGADNDRGNSVQETLDGGYVVLGTTSSFGNVQGGHVYLIKTDGKGDILWQKTYGGKRQQDGRKVRQTSDGGYIIVGSSNSFSGEEDTRDVYLIKTDRRGEIEWERTYGGPGYDDGTSVHQTLDGGYVVVGRKGSFREGVENSGNVADLYLIKTDAAGASLWEKTYGGKGLSAGHSVLQTEDGGYYVTGTTDAFSTPNEYEAYVIRTDDEGIVLWEKTYKGPVADYWHPNIGIVDTGYFIAGTTGPNGAHMQIFLIKMDNSTFAHRNLERGTEK